MSEIRVIEGAVFRDSRGEISHMNEFHFEDVRRWYFIHHPDTSVVRGWHGHQDEKKWFYCVKGEFKVACVKIDDWENPSADLPAEIFRLSEKDNLLVCVPKGYANCLKTDTPDSVMLVLSEKLLPEALHDSWRYDKSMWVDWSQI